MLGQHVVAGERGRKILRHRFDHVTRRAAVMYLALQRAQGQLHLGIA